MLAIHFDARIEWQGRRVQHFSEGLKRLGIDHKITSERTRISDVAILFGTTLWRSIERDGTYLLVDRCSFGHGDKQVSLVWNGHGLRGDHCVPESYDGSRWETRGVKLAPWQSGARSVLCGQTESYSPHWALRDWYASHPEATHFRPHPAGANETRLPELNTWDDVGLAITLNSSVAIDALIHGVPVTVDDEGGMAYQWGERFESRDAFFRWLAWTQWTWYEIRAGEPIRHLFRGYL